ncbi:hypothetical protein JYU34_014861 [Plutella xylostella]|uniref:Uncharacterized protein n=1 Tax=Plutella xylostella TaxID=51655 RepID=A0ABQ7Q5U2_PLUXY|nr:hypothetical protein JYU34_014861 [Plutella xylostella]
MLCSTFTLPPTEYIRKAIKVCIFFSCIFLLTCLSVPSESGLGGTCGPQQFHCYLSDTCVAAAAACDGRASCPRGEDEAACPCAPGAVRCAVGGQCVPQV